MEKTIGLAVSLLALVGFTSQAVYSLAHPVLLGPNRLTHYAWVFQTGIDTAATKWRYLPVPTSFLLFWPFSLLLITASFAALIKVAKTKPDIAEPYEHVHWIGVGIIILVACIWESVIGSGASGS